MYETEGLSTSTAGGIETAVGVGTSVLWAAAAGNGGIATSNPDEIPKLQLQAISVSLAYCE